MTLSVSLCPLRLRKRNVETLLVRRRFWHSREHRPTRYPGEWAFPGGNSEPCDRHHIDTALREFREELSYTGPFKETFFLRQGMHDKDDHFTIKFFGACIDPKRLKANKDEIISYAWKTPEEWLANITSQEYTDELEAAYLRLGLSDTTYGKYAITRRRLPVENIKTLHLLKKKEPELLHLLRQHPPNMRC